MSQEQTEILQMLAEGKISVEEAERLLQALQEGQEKQSAAGGHEGRRQQPVQEVLTSVKETIAGIGPMVARMVGEITTEIHKDRNFPGEDDAEGLPEIPFEGGRFKIDPGARLYIRSDKDGGPSGGDLQVESIEGEFCQLEADEARNLRVWRSSSGPVIRWAGGPLKVKAPQAASELFAYMLAGDLRVQNLHCPVQLKSMGGDVKLVGPSHRYSAKTIGGNIRLRLGPVACGSSAVRSMGGNIRIEVPEGVASTETEAVTVGGSIIVEDDLGDVRKSVTLGRQKVRLFLGDGKPGTLLKVKNLGGNIEIRRVRHE